MKGLIRWKKTISVFIDESGDFGLIVDSSKYFILTLVFHDQSKNISEKINSIDNYHIFHAGPIIRRESPYLNVPITNRKSLFQKIFMFTFSLPITFKSFSYKKKDYAKDILKMEAKMIRDIFNFFNDNNDKFKDYLLRIYYDNGQYQITRILNSALAITGLNIEFKKGVKSENYRLFQVADFISTIKLLELKEKENNLSLSEEKFVNRRNLKNVYLRTINKKRV